MVTIESLLEKVKFSLPTANLERLTQAFEFAKRAHEGQKRYSGEPYIVHPLETAHILADFRPDDHSLVAALLHDVSEDTKYTLDDIEKHFGKEVRSLVHGMEKLGRVRSYGDKSQVDNLQKMFLSMANDFRVALIKLCDRLHNMRTLHFVPPHKQLRIAQETLEIYAPIAARLGIYRLKTALEDHAFKFIDPKAYEEIESQLVESEKFRESFIQESGTALKSILSREGFQVEVEGRVKGIYSIFRKMQRKNKGRVADVFDVFAMRVIFPDIAKYGREYVGHLYAALGVVHHEFSPLMNRFKDYVAVPKANGYRSLHTTVMGLGSKTHTQPTEVQLRSQSMHDQSEFGIAAHWLYEEQKDGKAVPEIPESRHFDWLQNLAKLKEEGKGGEDFFENLKLDVFQDRIFIFTPRGDVMDLPKGATPIDFAYLVHSEIGNHCHQAKVNGSLVPLNYTLKNGEVVEIMIRNNARPNQNWISFVKTNLAKNRIRAWFRDQDKEKNVKYGKENLNQYLARLGKPPLSPDLSLLKVVGGKRQNLQERENILIELGKGTMMVGSLIRRIFTLDEIIASMSFLRKKEGKISTATQKTESKQVILVAGQPNMPVRFPQCCKPTAADSVKGFVTRGKGVTIHKKECHVFVKTDPARWVSVQWAESGEQNLYRMSITVEVSDRTGLIRDLGDAVAKMGLNIEDIAQKTLPSGDISVNFIIAIQSFDELERILQTLEMIPSVNRAYLTEN